MLIRTVFLHLCFSLFFLCFAISTKGQARSVNLDSLLSELSGLPEDTSKILLLTKIGVIYYRKDDGVEALKYINQAIELAEKIADYDKLAAAYNIRGNIYRIFSDSPQMLKEFLEAEKYYRKVNNEKGLSQVLTNMGGVYYDIGQDSIALEHLEKAIKIKKAVKDSLGMGLAMIGQAMCYNRMGMAVKEFELYIKAEELFIALGEKNALTNLYYSISQMYSNQKDFIKAKYYCQVCKDLAKEMGKKIHAAIALGCIINSNIALNDLDTAKLAVNELLPLLSEMQALDVIKDSYSVIKKYYEALGDYKNAYHYSELHQAYTDSIYLQEKEKHKDFINTLTKLKFAEKEAERLLSEQKQKDALIFQQFITVLISLFAILVIAVLLYFQFKANIKAKKANELLEQQQKEISERKQELEKINATKDQLFSIISHDLISPVIALNGILELLKEGTITPEDMPEFIEEAMIEVGNTTVFLRNLLFWAKNQMEGFVLHKEKIDISELINANIELMQPQICKKQVEIKSHVSENSLVLADKELLNTVIRNLIANAIKFTTSGGFISISASEEAIHLKITVKDTGIGIPIAVQGKILGDDLYSTRGTENEKGTGIGLALCKQFVQKNNGTISFESEEGKGSTFYFTVPKYQ